MHKKTGTRAEVWEGTAEQTSGGLTRQDLTLNMHGKIVSKAKSNIGKVLGSAYLKDYRHSHPKK